MIYFFHHALTQYFVWPTNKFRQNQTLSFFLKGNIWTRLFLKHKCHNFKIYEDCTHPIYYFEDWGHQTWFIQMDTSPFLCSNNSKFVRMIFQSIACLYKTSFGRQFNVVWMLWTSDRRQNNVVCLLGFVIYVLYVFLSLINLLLHWITKVIEENCSNIWRCYVDKKSLVNMLYVLLLEWPSGNYAFRIFIFHLFM